MAKKAPLVNVNFSSLAGGGQTIGKDDEGRVIFAWGALPSEQASVQLTKRKKSWAEGVAVEIIEASPDRIAPRDPESYLSTSPWQIMHEAAETRAKTQLIHDAFRLHNIELESPTIWSDSRLFHYRNKVEFSWWWTTESNKLDLAFYRRGSHTRLPVEGTSLASEPMNQAARTIRDLLRQQGVEARALKSLIVRTQADGQIVAALYAKAPELQMPESELATISHLKGFSLIYSDPRSPASVTTKVVQTWGEPTLTDTILDTPYHYAVDGFFQVNLPVYEQALRDMSQWLTDEPLVDMYSGVGTIGISLARLHHAPRLTLVEENPICIAEMQRNIADLKLAASVVQASSEQALEHITPDCCLIVDPPRAGLHKDVVEKILTAGPKQVLYLSCNPVTQARDVALLQSSYQLIHQQGYNFFPRTPHCENLIILDRY